MSEVMGSFEKELGGISKQIQSMLDESIGIQTTLTSRQAVEVELEVLTANVVIDDELIAGIYRAPMNETFMHYVKMLAKKRAFIQGARARSEALGDLEPGESSNLKALEDLEPELSKLQDKMVGRIRHYLLHKIYSLQKPTSNIQILQQNMIKHQPLYNVLVDFNLDIASEVKTQYVHTVVNLFYAQFKQYVASLTKCSSELASKSETIGQLDTGRQRVTPGLFALGDRGKSIIDIDNISPSTMIIPHIATSEKKTYHFERIFLSLQRVLLDTVSGELAFQKDFFNSDMFSLVFSPIITWYEDTVQSYLNNCHDVIGALLMMVILERDTKTMHERGFPHLDPYLAKQKQRVSTRLQTIFDNHIESIVSINLEDLSASGLDTRPHYLTRRYAEFSAAINSIITHLESDAHKKIVNGKVKSLHMQFQSLLTYMADTLAGEDSTKHRVFLVNNYSVILDILASHGLENVLEAQEFQMHFDGEMIRCVEYELQTHFSFLLVFIKRPPEDPVDQKAVTNFAKAFNSHWKAILKKISTDMMRSFPNLRVGVLIMKSVFSQLLTYYKRFEEILRNHHKDFYQQIQVEFVPHASLTYEFGLYTSDFS
jgi:hypothetical protein